jgi:hypothetical protein
MGCFFGFFVVRCLLKQLAIITGIHTHTKALFIWRLKKGVCGVPKV